MGGVCVAMNEGIPGEPYADLHPSRRLSTAQ
jgi:hypothetical protein